jgi:hypothetical protein
MMRVHKVRNFIVVTLKEQYFKFYCAAQYVSLSRPWTPQHSRDFPVDAVFLRDEDAALGETIKWMPCVNGA